MEPGPGDQEMEPQRTRSPRNGTLKDQETKKWNLKGLGDQDMES